MINGAITLFKDVDINSDGFLEWEEFLQYIMDIVMNESVVPVVDIGTGKYTSIEDQVEQKHYEKFRKYHKSVDERFIDPITNHIKRIVYPVTCTGQNMNCVIHCEDRQAAVQVYNLDMKVEARIAIPVKSRNVQVLGLAC